MKRLLVALMILVIAGASRASAAPSLQASAAERRAKLLRAIPEGILVVQSADRSQPNLLEFMVPDTENHDFIYLTGVDRGRLPGSTLILNPRGDTYREILYTSDDVGRMKQLTGIEHVFPQKQLADDAVNLFLMSPDSLSVQRSNLQGYPGSLVAPAIFLGNAYFS